MGTENIVTYRTLASGATAEIVNGKVVTIDQDHRGCGWLVERPNPAMQDPEWYADFPSDLTVIEECGWAIEAGSTTPHCPGHHEMATMSDLEFEARYDRD